MSVSLGMRGEGGIPGAFGKECTEDRHVEESVDAMSN